MVERLSARSPVSPRHLEGLLLLVERAWVGIALVRVVSESEGD